MASKTYQEIFSLVILIRQIEFKVEILMEGKHYIILNKEITTFTHLYIHSNKIPLKDKKQRQMEIRPGGTN